jgi:hypothetical protein
MPLGLLVLRVPTAGSTTKRLSPRVPQCCQRNVVLRLPRKQLLQRRETLCREVSLARASRARCVRLFLRTIRIQRNSCVQASADIPQVSNAPSGRYSP